MRSSFHFSLAYVGKISLDEFIKKEDNEIISAIRRIVLEEAKIIEFKRYLRVNRLKETILSIKDLGNYIFLIHRKSYWKHYREFNDRGGNFNYIEAYIGYHMFMGFKKYYLGIPTPADLFMSFKKISLVKPKLFMNMLENALNFSKMLNSKL